MENTFQPVSRGLIAHFQYMSDASLKFFVYCLLTAKAVGDDRGTFKANIQDISRALNWPLRKVYRTIRELDPYIEVKLTQNMWEQPLFKVKDYKGVEEFYSDKKRQSSDQSNSKSTDQSSSQSNDKVTDNNSIKINDLQVPNKVISKKVKKNSIKKIKFSEINGVEWRKAQPISFNQSDEDYLKTAKWWIENAPDSYWREINERLNCDSFMAAKEAFTWLENSGEKRDFMGKLMFTFIRKNTNAKTRR